MPTARYGEASHRVITRAEGAVQASNPRPVKRCCRAVGGTTARLTGEIARAAAPTRIVDSICRMRAGSLP
jgi:hypothetical protein